MDGPSSRRAGVRRNAARPGVPPRQPIHHRRETRLAEEPARQEERGMNLAIPERIEDCRRPLRVEVGGEDQGQPLLISRPADNRPPVERRLERSGGPAEATLMSAKVSTTEQNRRARRTILG